MYSNSLRHPTSPLTDLELALVIMFLAISLVQQITLHWLKLVKLFPSGNTAVYLLCHWMIFNLHLWSIHAHLHLVIVITDRLFGCALLESVEFIRLEDGINQIKSNRTNMRILREPNLYFIFPLLMKQFNLLILILIFSSCLPIIISLFHNLKYLSVPACSLILSPIFLITTSVASFPLS